MESCVFFEARIEFLNVIWINFGLRGFIRHFILQGRQSQWSERIFATGASRQRTQRTAVECSSVTPEVQQKRPSFSVWERSAWRRTLHSWDSYSRSGNSEGNNDSWACVELTTISAWAKYGLSLHLCKPHSLAYVVSMTGGFENDISQGIWKEAAMD
jgi:hypothetical protein